MSSLLTGGAQPMTPARWLLAALLAGALFKAGMESDAVFAALTRFWQALFEVVGRGGVISRWQQGTSHLVTTRSLPAMASYTLLYVGTCLLLLQLLLRSPRQMRWVLQLYLGLLGLSVLLLLVGKLGSLDWAYKLSRRIIDFVVSPLPVMLLLPLLWPGRRGKQPIQGKVPR